MHPSPFLEADYVLHRPDRVRFIAACISALALIYYMRLSFLEADNALHHPGGVRFIAACISAAAFSYFSMSSVKFFRRVSKPLT